MDIFVVDDQPPEAAAMLQALYSRSAKSAREHLEIVRERGSAKFMSSYYVGYGHASIGDCGTTTLFIENVSIIAAKAIQDNPLYSGQETSTRYIDFSKQSIHKPIELAIADSIHYDLMAFYESSQDILFSHLSEAYGSSEGKESNTHVKALHARKFDILRAFLPAGVKTQLSWSTNLRQASEHLKRLSYHPLSEVREISEKAFSALYERYPSSFSQKRSPEADRFPSFNDLRFHYPTQPLRFAKIFSGKLLFLDQERLDAFNDLLSNRSQYAPLPRECARIARYRFQFPIDFGSYRDLQRHRNGFCPNPILTPNLGFENWYLEQLPVCLRTRATELLASVEERLERLGDGSHSRAAEIQYYVPMGYRVTCDLEYDLNEAIYVSELRSGQTTHPTLRVIANQMAEVIRNSVGSITLYNDAASDIFSLKRGKQDIVRRDFEND